MKLWVWQKCFMHVNCYLNKVWYILDRLLISDLLFMQSLSKFIWIISRMFLLKVFCSVVSMDVSEKLKLWPVSILCFVKAVLADFAYLCALILSVRYWDVWPIYELLQFKQGILYTKCVCFILGVWLFSLLKNCLTWFWLLCVIFTP